MLFMFRRWLLNHTTKKQEGEYRLCWQTSSSPASLPYSWQTTTEHTPFPALC